MKSPTNSCMKSCFAWKLLIQKVCLTFCTETRFWYLQDYLQLFVPTVCLDNLQLWFSFSVFQSWRVCITTHLLSGFTVKTEWILRASHIFSRVLCSIPPVLAYLWCHAVRNAMGSAFYVGNRNWQTFHGHGHLQACEKVAKSKESVSPLLSSFPEFSIVCGIDVSLAHFQLFGQLTSVNFVAKKPLFFILFFELCFLVDNFWMLFA